MTILFLISEFKEPIMGGEAQITGGFTLEEAQNLAILLRAGALPVKGRGDRKPLCGAFPGSGFYNSWAPSSSSWCSPCRSVYDNLLRVVGECWPI